MSKREPLFFCFCGPSGTGKSTICKEIVRTDTTLRLSISTTTRAPRSEEQDGVAYYFVDPAAFEKRIVEGEFLEHAQYGSNRYGTELRNVRAAGAAGQDLVLDIDVQGISLIRERFKDRVIAVFVAPPSFLTLEERLSGRGSESEEERARRLQRAKEEIAILMKPGFSDYLLVNDQLSFALSNANSIIAAERLRFHRQAADTLRPIICKP